MSQTYDQVWELERIFAGGSHSPQLSAMMKQVEQDLQEGQRSMTELAIPQSLDETAGWQQLLADMQKIAAQLSEISAFCSCLTAQDVKDTKAVQLSGNVQQLSAQYESLITDLDDRLSKFDDAVWTAFIQSDAIVPIAFALNESRNRAKDKMDPAQERLAQALAVDGYHGWDSLYNILVGNMTIPASGDPKAPMLSVGQAENLLSSGDREVRAAAYGRWEEAWTKHEDQYAGTLNHLAGFRLNLYAGRGWDDVLKEPLAYNRMSAATLDAMWGAIEDCKSSFLPFLERKAQMLGVERLAWHDVAAPLSVESDTSMSFDEAAAFIIRHFSQFSPKMADFAEMAFSQKWIEAEDRTGKRPGGFCTSFPLAGESRIFMTFDGTANSVATLAHELGHAYHQYVMDDLPPYAQQYAMNVAETASTFAEMIVADAAVKQTTSREERIGLLENKIGRSIAFFMNIHARFLFETRFYEQRRAGMLTASQLNELMVQAQRDAFCDTLADYHPHFWAAKLHFHITSVPFYNFPYTFGYLFSLGVYAHAMKSGQNFEDRYIALLRDTGRMSTEELASVHMQVDLTDRAFWTEAIACSLEDVREFMNLTSS